MSPIPSVRPNVSSIRSRIARVLAALVLLASLPLTHAAHETEELPLLVVHPSAGGHVWHLVTIEMAWHPGQPDLAARVELSVDELRSFPGALGVVMFHDDWALDSMAAMPIGDWLDARLVVSTRVAGLPVEAEARHDPGLAPVVHAATKEVQRAQAGTEGKGAWVAAIERAPAEGEPPHVVHVVVWSAVDAPGATLEIRGAPGVAVRSHQTGTSTFVRPGSEFEGPLHVEAYALAGGARATLEDRTRVAIADRFVGFYMPDLNPYVATEFLTAIEPSGDSRDCSSYCYWPWSDIGPGAPGTYTFSRSGARAGERFDTYAEPIVAGADVPLPLAP